MPLKPITKDEIDLTSDYLRFMSEAYELQQKKPFSVEDNKRVDCLLRMAEISRLRAPDGAITRTTVEAKLRQVGLDIESWERAENRLIRYGWNGLDSREHGILGPHRKRVDASEERAMGVAGTAGFIVSPTNLEKFQEHLKDFDPFRLYATVVSYDRGSDANWPGADDLSIEGELLSESSSAAEQDIPFNQTVLKAHKFSSRIVRVSREAAEDAPNFSEIVFRLLASRIGRIQQRLFTVGSGSGEPLGVVTASSQGRVGASGQTASIVLDDLIELEYSVPSVYRSRAIWVMADSTAKFVEKLKDSAGAPLIQPGRELGQKTLRSYPLVINNHVSAMQANARSVIFGDLKEFVVRDVNDMILIRLQERYAERGQLGFLAILRSDSRLLNSAAVRYYQNAAS